jgi:hypothetical protein
MRGLRPMGAWIGQSSARIPRVVFLLPPWSESVRTAGHDLKFAFCLRDLHDVARSLQHRNGLSYNRSAELSVRYNLAALRVLPEGTPIIRCERLLATPVACLRTRRVALFASKFPMDIRQNALAALDRLPSLGSWRRSPLQWSGWRRMSSRSSRSSTFDTRLNTTDGRKPRLQRRYRGFGMNLAALSHFGSRRQTPWIWNLRRAREARMREDFASRRSITYQRWRSLKMEARR